MTGKPKRKVAKTKKKKSARKAAGREKPAAKPKKCMQPKGIALAPLALVSKPGIRNVVELKNQLKQMYQADAAAVIDASNVDSIDTAALQLLAAFANSMREQSRILDWKAPSDEFCAAAELVDLRGALGIADAHTHNDDDDLCPVF